MKSFFTNPWTYGGLLIILSVFVIAFCLLKAVIVDDIDTAAMWIISAIFIGGTLVALTILYIRNVCLK